MNELGFVVVGLGRAGMARIRDLQALPGCHLVGTVSRRPGTGCLTLDEALEHPRVDVAVIATDNASHGALAQAFLRAGKHVLVDFPLATDVGSARQLFELASSRQLCLHTELLGLLTPDHAVLRAACHDLPPRQLDLVFTGGYDGWLAEEAVAGHWGNLAVARLHTLWDLAGPLLLQHVELQADATGYLLRVRLLGHAGCTVQLREERRQGMGRLKTLTGVLAGGTPLPQVADSAQSGLFLRDLQACIERIRSRGDTGAYVDDETVLAVLELADGISRMASRSNDA